MADTSNPQPSTHVVRINPAAPGHRRGFFHDLFSFLGWVLTGFGLIGMFRKKGEHYSIEEVVVYSVHRSFFLWPLILVGFVGGWMVNHHMTHLKPGADPGNLPHIMGWIYIWVMLYTFVVMMFDVGTLNFLLVGFVFAFLWLAARYLSAVKNIHFLSDVVMYLRHLRPNLDPGFATVMSWLLLGPWIGALFRTFTQGRKSFTPNSVEEWSLGVGSKVFDRSGYHFTTRYNDLLKMVLGIGSGDIVMQNNTSNTPVETWRNILFLAFFWKRLEEILEQRAAVVETERGEPLAVESQRKP